MKRSLLVSTLALLFYIIFVSPNSVSAQNNPPMACSGFVENEAGEPLPNILVNIVLVNESGNYAGSYKTTTNQGGYWETADYTSSGCSDISPCYISQLQGNISTISFGNDEYVVRQFIPTTSASTCWQSQWNEEIFSSLVLTKPNQDQIRWSCDETTGNCSEQISPNGEFDEGQQCNNTCLDRYIKYRQDNYQPPTPQTSISGPYACPDGQSIKTAIGCIPINNINSLVGFFLRWALGIGAGAAFLLIIFAAFQIITSSGNPDQINAGKQLITSALSGLLLLIFAVTLLQLIGIQILHLPGLI